MKKFIWLAVSVMMVISLILAACTTPASPTPPVSTSTPTTPTTPAPSTPTTEKPQQEPAPPAAESPKYGGTLTYRLASDITSFDSGAGGSFGELLNTVYEQYLTADWTRGPAGSGVTNFAGDVKSIYDLYGPQLAESWEIPEAGVWILKIRQGVHWQPVDSEAGRLMGNRKLTADDIVSSFNRLKESPGSAMVRSQPVTLAAASIEKTGPWEVTLRTPIDYLNAFFWLVHGSSFARVYPPEVVEKYGDLEDWRNAVGTGPFMISDYVPGSSVTYVRNPDYWGKDLLGPGEGNQLPYLDSVRELIIPDLSTTLAALRTGKLDLQSQVSLEDGLTVLKTSPDLEYLKYLGIVPLMNFMRLDKPDKPFHDIRVRQALMLATDFEAIKRDYYNGGADIDIWPVTRDFEGSGYVPLEEMPESVKDLYQYNPEKAKQLLAEAGYPSGFKAEIIVSSAGSNVDEVAIFKSMWAKVGIELNLQVKEAGVYGSISRSGNWEDMRYGTAVTHFLGAYSFGTLRGSLSSYINNPRGSDPVIEETFAKMEQSVFINWPEYFRLFGELRPHLLEQAYVIPRPTPYTYTFWWPWLKNYYGQHTAPRYFFTKYFWIDQDMKKLMGY